MTQEHCPPSRGIRSQTGEMSAPFTAYPSLRWLNKCSARGSNRGWHLQLCKQPGGWVVGQRTSTLVLKYHANGLVTGQGHGVSY